ncbi:hypothetical protein Tco_1075677, partial [Tanacetum coccineum]
LLDYYGYDNIEDYLSNFYFPSTDKEDTIVHTGQDPIHKCHSPISKAKYVPVSQKHNQNVKSPTPIKGCVLGLLNVDTWDDILKNFRMRTPGRCIDKWMNGKDYGKDNHHIAQMTAKDLPVAKKPILKVIFKRHTPIKGCVLGLANVETWDNIMKKFGMRTPGRSCTLHLQLAYAHSICTLHLQLAFTSKHLHIAFVDCICTLHLYIAFAACICKQAFAHYTYTLHLQAKILIKTLLLDIGYT